MKYPLVLISLVLTSCNNPAALVRLYDEQAHAYLPAEAVTLRYDKAPLVEVGDTVTIECLRANDTYFKPCLCIIVKKARQQ